MNKKILKIGAVLLILGFIIPVIATATIDDTATIADISNSVLASKNALRPTLTSKTPDIDLAPHLHEEDMLLEKNEPPESMPPSFKAKIKKAQSLDYDKINLRGKWGLYGSKKEGKFVAYKSKIDIIGIAYNNGQKAYFYILLNSITENFRGVTLYKGTFRLISGSYISEDGNFVAMWHVRYWDGWFVGE